MPNILRGGAVFVLIGVLGYVMLPVWIRNIQPSGLQPMDIATWRFLFAAPLMWLLIGVLRTPRPDKPLPLIGLLGLGVLLMISALSVFFGLERVPASTFIVLFYTYPAMVALINLALGERLPLQSWLALALTLTGVALTVPDFGAGLTSEMTAGILIAFVNAFSVAVYFVLNGRLLKGHNATLWASAWAITGACVSILLVTAARGGAAVPPDAKTWLLLIAMAVVSTVMPINMFMVGIQRLGASRASILSTLEPIGTLIVASLLLGETLEPIQLVGAGLILMSVLLLQIPVRRPAPAAAALGAD
jgi:drug/metabolite transporter (DMT)-like permease